MKKEIECAKCHKIISVEELDFNGGNMKTRITDVEVQITMGHRGAKRTERERFKIRCPHCATFTMPMFKEDYKTNPFS